MVAGVGCRAGVSGEQVLAAIDAAMEAVRTTEATQHRTLTAIATPASKVNEPGIRAAAAARVVPLLAIAQSDLEAANPATVTRSAHSMAAMNVHSVAEAAALAGAAALVPRASGAAMATGATAAALADGTPAAALAGTPGAALADGTPATGAAAAHAAPHLLLPRIVVGPVTCALASVTT